jgi:hypothetical protein
MALPYLLPILAFSMLPRPSEFLFGPVPADNVSTYRFYSCNISFIKIKKYSTSINPGSPRQLEFGS